MEKSGINYEVRPDTQLHILPELLIEHVGYKTDGCFVEVGAYDGMSYSHTWGLSKAGWKGLFIEPLQSAMDQCRINHYFNPLIEYEQCVCTDFDGAERLYVHEDTSTTLLNKYSTAWGVEKDNYIMVPAKTLNTVLKEHKWPRSFDVLSIDVEEAELRVLSGLDLMKWRPKMIIIELHELVAGKNWKFRPVLSWLAGYGYRRIYGDTVNTIFLL